ncbi:ATP-binding protein [Actinobacillus equuli subsp. haemolyticus]|uniref:AAA family ATPase n=1 Tax=Actinobacillus equuli TaxID=718 RepID=UPI002442EDA0|nr:AAA family ATPase [Actinobacillus equuli]WGE71469.1 ATP-binding protein [Actinobacillus equuli subsp. haemolyticus]
MKENKIELNLIDFRAINTANILLNGVTIVSGINGCGKSTISKLLYYTFNTINKFNYIVVNKNIERFNQYKDIFNFIIDSATFRNYSFSERKNIRKNFELKFTIPYTFNEIGIDKTLEIISEGIDIIKNLNYENINDRRSTLIIKSRLFELNSKDTDFHDLDFEDLLNILINMAKDEIRSIIYKIFEEYESKPKKYLDDIIKNIFKTDALPKSIDIYEYNSILISSHNRKIVPSYLIKNAIYIDTPMSFQSSNKSYGYWEDLNNLLNSESYTNNDRKISNDISRKILNAEINLNKDLFYNRFIYRRLSDSLELELENCATGIKSLGILYILIKNGTINSNSLLIIDEPEAHLHPQWIVEYAKILIQLRKEIGCNLFISSHNPDFIQALSVISEKENLLDEVNFYLAEEEDNGGFHYHNLKNNIGPIFKCFNKSLDKLETY